MTKAIGQSIRVMHPQKVTTITRFHNMKIVTMLIGVGYVFQILACVVFNMNMNIFFSGFTFDV